MIPVENFGPQHWQMLLILEGSEVAGRPVDISKLRCNPTSHPKRVREGTPAWTPDRGTRLRDGTTLSEHDDWDCLDDISKAGLLRWGGSGANPVFALTDLGWRVAGQARRHAALHGVIDTFKPGAPERRCPPLSVGPVQRPTVGDGAIARSERGHVDVAVGGVYFCFRETGEGWQGGDHATTHALDHELDEGWLVAARTVAIETLQRQIARDAGQPDPAIETLRCPECKRLLTGRGPNGLTLARDVGVLHGGIVCGTYHVVRFRDGLEIAVFPGGVLELVAGDP